MKNRNSLITTDLTDILFIILSFLCTVLLPTVASTQTYLEEILIKWKNSGDYLMDIAEAMPDSLYDFQATQDQMTFKEQVFHMCDNMTYLSHKHLGYNLEPKPDKPGKKAAPSQIKLFLKDALDYANRAIANETPESLNDKTNFFAGPMTHRQIINLMNDHVTHHRGQLIVYLRLNGIVPGRYVGW